MGTGFDYTDYRDLLKEAYEDRKAANAQFSYKSLAELLGLDGGGTFRILNKERHLPARCVSRALDFLGLSGRSAEYFVLMTSYARERRKAARQELYDRALALRDVPRRRLEGAELAFVRDWWVVATRFAVEVLEGRAIPEEIARRLVPSLDPTQVRSALQLLLELGIARKTQGGRLKMVDQHLTADGAEGRLAVAEFQQAILGLARESLERFPREVRDISTLTVTVDKDAFADIREILRDCRRRIQKRVGESEHPDRVLQVAMAVFPLFPPLEETL